MNSTVIKKIVLVTATLIVAISFFIFGQMYSGSGGQITHLADHVYKIINSNLFSGTFSILVAAIIAGYFGFNRYRNQKNYDEIHKRYIQSIDDLIFHISNNRIISENNYTNILQILRNFRERKPDEFKKWLVSKSFKLESISPHMPHSFFTVSQMLQDESLQKVAITNFVDLSADNEFFISEVPLYIETELLADPLKYKDDKIRESLVEEIRKEVQKHRDRIDIDGLYKFISILESISFLAKQANIDTYKKLDYISQVPTIKIKLIELKEISDSLPSNARAKIS